jgi:predicted ester cyclase
MNSNKEIVSRYLKAYEDCRTVERFLHPKHEYFPPGGAKPASLCDRLRGEAFFFAAFSEIKVVIEDQIAEGDKVASRIAMHCVHSGEYQGIGATNRRITITYMSICQIEDGLILKEWAEFNMPSILGQLQ